ncbi:MAG: NAD(P)/FAD-dependent oxidoreductase [bacterium]
MQKEVEITLKPEELDNLNLHKILVTQSLKLSYEELSGMVLLKRSIDSRKKPVFKLRYLVFINETPKELAITKEFKPVNSDKKVIIVGSGPAGLFAALKLIELGIKPIIFERGKNVRDRRIDLKNIQQNNLVDENSNYCFGEGGAGTYSDGKLYTRATKRGDILSILNLFVQHGADTDILVDSHPHIGSNRLPKIIEAIRETILKCNGEINFNSLVTDFIIKNNKVFGVVINNSKEVLADSVILATGHSARDIYKLCVNKKVQVAEKDFAIGVRIEHPQQLIDHMQYSCQIRPENLPASSYNIATEVEGLGVYSFCMCPGGLIIPAATTQEEIVLNGMSVSKRDSEFANAGLVTTVTKDDFLKEGFNGLFAGIQYQKKIEKKAFELAGKTQKAPAQRVIDFIEKKVSSTLPESSYIPGIFSASLDDVLPRHAAFRLRKGLMQIGSKIKGYVTNDAIMLAPETRTSSPLRIVRNENFRSVNIEGLYPVGEGAGYAGGIISAALDGQNCAERININ